MYKPSQVDMRNVLPWQQADHGHHKGLPWWISDTWQTWGKSVAMEGGNLMGPSSMFWRRRWHVVDEMAVWEFMGLNHNLRTKQAWHCLWIYAAITIGDFRHYKIKALSSTVFEWNCWRMFFVRIMTTYSFPQVFWVAICVFYLLSGENCWRDSSWMCIVKMMMPRLRSMHLSEERAM